MKKSIFLPIFASLLFIGALFADDKPKINFEVKPKTRIYEGIEYKKVGFTAENFPVDTPLMLSSMLINNQINYRTTVKVNAAGQLINSETNEEEILHLGPFGPGEPVTVLLNTPDASVKAMNIILINPLEVKDDLGHSISLMMMDPTNEHFSLTASGFNPNEEVEFYSGSCDELMRHKIKMNDQGKIEMGLSPAVLKKSGGPAFVKIKGKTSNLKLDYFWGKQSILPTKPKGRR